MALSIIFAIYIRNGFKKMLYGQTFILRETSLVLKKDKCSIIEKILMLKFDK